MINQYENAFRDGMKMAWIEAEVAEEVLGANDTQFMLIQLALDQAAKDPEFRQIMLSRYSQMLDERE